MCVGVTLQCGYGGVVSVCRLKPGLKKNLDDTSRLDVVEIACVPDMLPGRAKDLSAPR